MVRVALSGPGEPLPRGLYSLVVSVSGDGAGLAAELCYRPDEPGREEAGIHLEFVARRRKASARFVVPEPARDLALRLDADNCNRIIGRYRIRRHSSAMAMAANTVGALARRLSHPSRWPGYVRRAAARLRQGGPAALVRAMRRTASVDAYESRMASYYGTWAARRQAVAEADRDRYLAEAGALDPKPLISVVMPVCDPDPQALREAIASVTGQFWPHWQLCIADDRSSNPQIAPLIRELAKDEPRIRTVFRQGRGHISAASNSAIELASGDWLAFLDHDDVLAPDALLEVARAINANPQAGLIYSDEDKIDANGERCRPSFKPDWNIDLFLSYNMINHLACYRAALVERAGGLRTGYEGAQDYDLALRVAENLEPGQIVHIPRILYHWRMSPDSVAADPQAKPYAMQAGERALNDYLARNAIAARADLEETAFRVTYALPSPPPRVSIIIATRDRLALLRTCIASIREKTDYPDYEIIVVDNGSKNRSTLEWLAQMERDGAIRVMRDDRPFNFSALNNAAVERASGDIVALVNNDIEVLTSGWLTEMAAICAQPGVGAVGARLLYGDGAIQHAGIVVNRETGASHWFRDFPGDYGGPNQRLRVRQRLSAVTGACLLTPRKLYRELGGLDEHNLPVAYNDVDYCLKVDKAGLSVVFTPYARLIHHESLSRGKDVTPARSARLYGELACLKKKWGARLERDPWAMPGLPPQLQDISRLR